MIRSPNTPFGNDPPDSFLTIEGSAESELKVQRSRFLALTFPVRTEQEARVCLSETARRYHDSRHVCYGYKLGVGSASITRKSDDGEPSGTAGDPILAAIGKLELTDVLLVVVRYFGGVKLGTGGLARAYGQAGAMALAEATIREVQLGREFMIRFPYSQEKSIRRLLETRGGRLVDQQYGEAVSWRIWLAHSGWRGFAEALTELTAGNVDLEEPENQ
ncbi:MAG: YigZ family protein [Candidatus Krumholzibacteria bacterium]|nr:YigZ family protein [Candidatus Krumholzibacteria bacterium]